MQAVNNMLAAALEEPRNQRLLLLSESCAPGEPMGLVGCCCGQAVRNMLAAALEEPRNQRSPLLFESRAEAPGEPVGLIIGCCGQAVRNMLAAALEEPRNQRFLLLSESCVPLYPPAVVYQQACPGVHCAFHPMHRPVRQFCWLERMR